MAKQIKNIEDISGVGAATAEKLREAGFSTLMSLAVATPGELVDIAGVGEGVARKIINIARENLDMGFETGEQLLNKRQNIKRISTGSKSFDTLVGGGFETGSITECYGPFGSGKTAIAHQLAINAQFTDSEQPTDIVIWLDSESTFRPERVKQMAEARGLDPAPLLQNIRCIKVYNSDHQMIIAEKIEDLITKENLPIKLVIVDSLTAHFRAEFLGRGTLADRQQKLNKHMHALMRLADLHNLCVYVTNQVMARPDVFFGDPTAAIGGNIVGHNATTRLYLRKGKKDTRVAKLVDSPYLPDGECIFGINEKGIADVE
ncbi:DNA repair and recombination protein RadA [archaeon]|nr:DNA repair and recombination protein RadA [archaeon]